MTVRIRKGGQTLMALALLCIGAGAAYGQGADWEGITDPIALGGGTDLLPAHSDQLNPSVACDSTGDGRALIIWEDHRTGEADIYGARIDGDGVILDERAFPIATGAATQTTPVIAYGGGAYLAVWVVEDENEWSIVVSRFDADGEMLDDPPIELAVSQTMLSGPDLTYGTSSFMVIWNDYSSGGAQTHGRRVSTDGVILDEDPLVLSPGDNQATPASIAFGGDRYLLAWSRADTLVEIDGTDTTLTAYGDIYAQFVSAEGVPADTLVLVEVWDYWPTNWNAFGAPAVCWSGTQYLMAWLTIREGAGGGNEVVQGRLISGEGIVDETRLVLTNSSLGRTDTDIATDGTDFFVSWGSLKSQYRGMYGAIVSGAGSVTAQDIRIIGIEYTPGRSSVVWTGSSYLTAFNAFYRFDALADHDVSINYFDATGTEIGPQVVVSQSGPVQIPAGAAFDGTRYLAVWDERVPAGWVMRGARIDQDGNLLDPDGFLIVPDTLALPAEAKVYSNGARFIVLWTENANSLYSRLYSVIMSADGATPGVRQEVFDRATPNARVGACWDGEHYLLSWRYSVPEADSSGLALGRYSTMIEGALAPLDTVVVTQSPGSDPTVVFDEIEQKISLFWASPATGLQTIQLAADAAWTNLPNSRTLFAAVNVYAIEAVTDASGYFLAWRDGNIPFGARLKPDATVLDPGRIRFAPDCEVIDDPALAYDGGNLLAAWREPGDDVWQIRGSRIASDGSLLDFPHYTFAGESSAARWPVMAAGSHGQVLLIYSAFLPGEEDGCLRTHARLWQQIPPEANVVIHQSQGVTSDVSVMIFPSEELANGAVTVHANGIPLTMDLVDEENNIYQGWFQAQASHVVNLVAVVDDSTGNRTVVYRSFSIGELGSVGGTIEGPHGAVALTCSPGGLTNNTYVMVLPDQVRGAWSTEDGFVLSPPGLHLQAPMTLTLAVDARARVAQPILERESATGWQPVTAAYWPADGIITAEITSLGHYRVSWDQGVLPSGNELALALDAAIWKSNLGITYQLPQTGHVRLALYDVTGRCVRTLVDGLRSGGEAHTAQWNGRDDQDHPVGGGVYFTRLRYENETRTARSILMK